MFRIESICTKNDDKTELHSGNMSIILYFAGFFNRPFVSFCIANVEFEFLKLCNVFKSLLKIYHIRLDLHGDVIFLGLNLKIFK